MNCEVNACFILRDLDNNLVECNSHVIETLLFFPIQGGFAMRLYIPKLMQLIVEALLDGAAATKREVAVATLGQVVQSTGYALFLCPLMHTVVFLS